MWLTVFILLCEAPIRSCSAQPGPAPVLLDLDLCCCSWHQLAVSVFSMCLILATKLITARPLDGRNRGRENVFVLLQSRNSRVGLAGSVKPLVRRVGSNISNRAQWAACWCCISHVAGAESILYACFALTFDLLLSVTSLMTFLMPHFFYSSDVLTIVFMG